MSPVSALLSAAAGLVIIGLLVLFWSMCAAAGRHADGSDEEQAGPAPAESPRERVLLNTAETTLLVVAFLFLFGFAQVVLDRPTPADDQVALRPVHDVPLRPRHASVASPARQPHGSVVADAD